MAMMITTREARLAAEKSAQSESTLDHGGMNNSQEWICRTCPIVQVKAPGPSPIKPTVTQRTVQGNGYEPAISCVV